MKLHDDPKTDSLYVERAERPGTDAREIGDGASVDGDEDEHPVGVDVDAASRRVDLATRDVVALPTPSGHLG